MFLPVQSGAPHLTVLPTLEVSLEARAVGSSSPDGSSEAYKSRQEKAPDGTGNVCSFTAI